MKRVIYIGPSTPNLHYGMTGVVTYAADGVCNFIPDGTCDLHHIRNSDVYDPRSYTDLRSKSCRLTVAT